MPPARWTTASTPSRPARSRRSPVGSQLTCPSPAGPRTTAITVWSTASRRARADPMRPLDPVIATFMPGPYRIRRPAGSSSPDGAVEVGGRADPSPLQVRCDALHHAGEHAPGPELDHPRDPQGGEALDALPPPDRTGQLGREQRAPVLPGLMGLGVDVGDHRHPGVGE